MQKKVSLTKFDVVVIWIDLRSPEHNKKGFAVRFKLWALVCIMRIFDGQIVQMKLLLYRSKQFFIGLMQAYPHELIRLLQDTIYPIEFEIRNPPSLAINGSIYDGIHNQIFKA